MPPAETIELAGQVGKNHVFSTVSAQHGEVQTTNLKPIFITLGLPPDAFKPEFRSASESETFDVAVGGGTLYPGIVWIFMGEDYIRLNLRTNELTGPTTIAGNWAKGTWPSTFARKIDAAITFTNSPNYIWFFRGEEYIVYNLATDQIETGPTAITAWSNWPETFIGGLDAGVAGCGNYEGIGWFFKGSEYIRYNNTTNTVDGEPRPIAGAWPGWPESFTSVDCAISGVGTESDIIYFLRGDQFIAYDLAADAVVGPPRQISTKLPALSMFLQHPQFFLVEAMQLKTYYGDISPGPPQGGTRSLDPRSSETYTIIVTRSETEVVSETMTVLDSQDSTLVENVNKSMNEEASNSQSAESYDYKFDSSFEGELSYTGLGGEVDASLSFQGSSNDVRKAAANAARNAIQTQVGRTEENRRQSTRVVAGTKEATSTLESTFTKSVNNPTEKPINIGVFQLFQEYLTFVVLSDVKVAFSNGAQPDIVPLSRLDVLVGRYTADPAQAELIKKAVVAELREVLNFQRKPIDVVKDVGGGRVEFDTELKSTFVVTNVDGTPRREIVVPGVVVEHYPFKQLTDAAVITEIDIG